MSEVWIPTAPEPWRGLLRDRCKCGARFGGRDRRERYEQHWHAWHAPAPGEGTVSMGVTRERAVELGYEIVSVGGVTGCRRMAT